MDEIICIERDIIGEFKSSLEITEDGIYLKNEATKILLKDKALQNKDDALQDNVQESKRKGEKEEERESESDSDIEELEFSGIEDESGNNSEDSENSINKELIQDKKNGFNPLCFPEKKRFWTFEEIASIIPKRVAGKDTALEIHFTDGTSILLDFYHEYNDLGKEKKDYVDEKGEPKSGLNKKEKEKLNDIDRKLYHQALTSFRGAIDTLKKKGKGKLKNECVIERPTQSIRRHTKLWRQGKISNFEYLLKVNEISGRSTKDLSIYPIFPWIFKEYTDKEPNLWDDDSYRDLSKVLGRFNEKEFKVARKKYKIMPRDPTGELKPFFWGTYISNHSLVVVPLIRVSPFFILGRDLQDGEYDKPDRIVNSVSKRYSNSIEGDRAELNPEFYYFPDFLRNDRRINLGTKQDGSRVDHVKLPWEKNAQEFIEFMKQAFEFPFVSKNISEWINLNFGYQLLGKEAKKVYNVYPEQAYCPYSDLLNEKPIYRYRSVSYLEEFGQVPKQIFTKKHLKKDPNSISYDVSTFKDVFIEEKDSIQFTYKKRFEDDSDSKTLGLSSNPLQYYRDFKDGTLLHFLIEKLRKINTRKIQTTAESRRYIRLFKRLIKTHPELINMRDYQGKTALFRAVEMGDDLGRYLAELLLEQSETNIDIVDRQQNSLLHMCLWKEDAVDWIKFLIRHGVNLDQYNRERRSVIEMAENPNRNMEHLVGQLRTNPYQPNPKAFNLLRAYQELLNKHLTLSEQRNVDARKLVGQRLIMKMERNNTPLSKELEITISLSSKEKKLIPQISNHQNKTFTFSSFFNNKAPQQNNPVAKSPVIISNFNLAKCHEFLNNSLRNSNQSDHNIASVKFVVIKLVDGTELKDQNISQLTADSRQHIEQEVITFQDGGSTIFIPEKNEFRMQRYHFSDFLNTGRLIVQSGGQEVDISELNKQHWNKVWEAMTTLGIRVYDKEKEITHAPSPFLEDSKDRTVILS